MSPPRKKRHLNPSSAKYEQKYAQVKELLLAIKPRLAASASNNMQSLVKELHQVAELAQSLTRDRPMSDPRPFADELDREGVSLWNASIMIKTGQAELEFFTALRLAGYRLIEAGLDSEPSAETLSHVLELSSKVGLALTAVNRFETANTVLTQAAAYEKSLQTANDSKPGLKDQGSCHARVLYYFSRMEAAWKQSNDGVAFWMLGKIVELGQSNPLDSLDTHLVAEKCLDIGKQILKSQPTEDQAEASQATEAIKWIQIAYNLIEKVESSETAGTANLKSRILRSLARGYYSASSSNVDHLQRADAVLKELFESFKGEETQRSSELKQLRWMSLAVSKRRKVPENILLDIFRSIIDHVDWSEEEVQDILLELRVVSQNHFSLVTDVLRHFLQHSLDESSGHVYTDKLLISLLVHCKGDVDHSRAIQTIDNACQALENAESYVMNKVPAIACLTLLWQFGDTHYHAKRWKPAADWFLLGTRRAFQVVASTTHSKCLRKAALCYIQAGELARATAITQKASSDEAATHYLSFMAFIYQGMEEEAIQALQSMAIMKDFDRKMLFLATDMARNSRNVLHAVLNALLRTIRSSDEDSNAQGITVTRCLVRLVLDMIAEPGANIQTLIPPLIQHFEAANQLIRTARAQKSAATFTKDIAWLWRTAYNSAIQGLGTWDDSAISRLFEVSQELMDSYCSISVMGPEKEVLFCRVLAGFAAISGRIFPMRLMENPQETAATCRSLASDLDGLRTATDAVLAQYENDPPSTTRLRAVLHSVFLYTTEVLVQLGDWDKVTLVIKAAATSSGAQIETYEAIADILWSHSQCPVPVLFGALEIILSRTMEKDTLSVRRLSRWLRAVCSILLSRDRLADRGKALAYVHQAIEVLQEPNGNSLGSEEHYPDDERQWLLSTSFNTGVTCLSSGSLEEAKEWFEVATVLCRFVPNGESKSQKIAQTYQDLLSRYGA